MRRFSACGDGSRPNAADALVTAPAPSPAARVLTPRPDGSRDDHASRTPRRVRRRRPPTDRRSRPARARSGAPAPGRRCRAGRAGPRASRRPARPGPRAPPPRNASTKLPRLKGCAPTASRLRVPSGKTGDAGAAADARGRARPGCAGRGTGCRGRCRCVRPGRGTSRRSAARYSERLWMIRKSTGRWREEQGDVERAAVVRGVDGGPRRQLPRATVDLARPSRSRSDATPRAGHAPRERAAAPTRPQATAGRPQTTAWTRRANGQRQQESRSGAPTLAARACRRAASVASIGARRPRERGRSRRGRCRPRRGRPAPVLRAASRRSVGARVAAVARIPAFRARGPRRRAASSPRPASEPAAEDHLARGRLQHARDRDLDGLAERALAPGRPPPWCRRRGRRRPGPPPCLP